MVSEPQRLELLQALERSLGASPANTLMTLLPPFEWSDVARHSDLVALRSDMTAVRAEMTAVRAEMTAVRADMTALEADLRSDITTVRAELATVRAELKVDIAELRTDLKSDIAAQVPRLLWTSLAIAVAFASLLFAALKLG